MDAWPTDGCTVKDAVDTLLAEWCLSGDVRRAVAAGSAACTMPGGEPPDLALVERLARNMV